MRTSKISSEQKSHQDFAVSSSGGDTSSGVLEGREVTPGGRPLPVSPRSISQNVSVLPLGSAEEKDAFELWKMKFDQEYEKEILDIATLCTLFEEFQKVFATERTKIHLLIDHLRDLNLRKSITTLQQLIDGTKQIINDSSAKQLDEIHLSWLDLAQVLWNMQSAATCAARTSHICENNALDTAVTNKAHHWAVAYTEVNDAYNCYVHVMDLISPEEEIYEGYRMEILQNTLNSFEGVLESLKTFLSGLNRSETH